MSGLDKPINLVQAQICGFRCTVNRFDENNELMTDINLRPADIFKWPANTDLPQVRIRLAQLNSG